MLSELIATHYLLLLIPLSIVDANHKILKVSTEMPFNNLFFIY